MRISDWSSDVCSSDLLAYSGYAVIPLTVRQAQASKVREPAQSPTVGRYAIDEDHPLLAASTTRQREVMRLLVTGLSNKAIAQQLTISESTVKAHIRAIMETLGVNNRTQRSEKRRVGKEGVGTCRSRWSPYH